MVPVSVEVASHFPFVIERLSNTLGHAFQKHLHARPIGAVGGGTPRSAVAVLTPRQACARSCARYNTSYMQPFRPRLLDLVLSYARERGVRGSRLRAGESRNQISWPTPPTIDALVHATRAPRTAKDSRSCSPWMEECKSAHLRRRAWGVWAPGLKPPRPPLALHTRPTSEDERPHQRPHPYIRGRGLASEAELVYQRPHSYIRGRALASEAELLHQRPSSCLIWAACAFRSSCCLSRAASTS